MSLIDKKSGEIRKLRRSHFEGLFVEVDLSKHYTAIQAKISNVQVWRSVLGAFCRSTQFAEHFKRF